MKKKNIQELPFFSQKLKALREERGLEQEDLAKALGVSRETVSYYENRAKNPTSSLVKKVAAFFNVPPEFFIADSDIEPQKLKPGPASKLERQLDAIRKLPRKDQQAISAVLDMALKEAK